MKLNDLINGTVVTMDEWVQNEIYRLRNNVEPRHFKDYSELVYMFEDPSRFQVLNMRPLNPPPPPPPELIFSSVQTDDDDDDEDLLEMEQVHTQENHNTNIPSIPPLWLCKAFIELIRYCDKLPSGTMNEPKKLLLAFEELQYNIHSGKVIHVNQFREQLSTILFGKIQLTEHLVTVWKSICEWVTKPPIHNHHTALRWIDLTMSAYMTAQKFVY